MGRPIWYGIMRTCLGFFLAAFAFQSLLQAQDVDIEPLGEQQPSARKEPSIFLRPAKKNASDQLAYAEALRVQGEQRKAARHYRALVHTWHDAAEAPAAQFFYAKLLMARGKYVKAFEEFQYLMDHYVGHFPYDEVLNAQFRIANHVRTARRLAVFGWAGFAAPERALPLFEQIVENGPRWERAPEAQYYVGLIHEQGGDDEAAVKAYETLRQRYPDSDFAVSASLRSALCLWRTALESRRDETAYWHALAALEGFLRQHPEHEGVARVRDYRDQVVERLAGMYYERAVYYDRTAQRPEAALIAYEDFLRRFPSSRRAAEVQTRAEALRKKVEAGRDE